MSIVLQSELSIYKRKRTTKKIFISLFHVLKSPLTPLILSKRLASSSVFWMHHCSMGRRSAIDSGDFEHFPRSGRQVDRFLGLCNTFKQQRKYLGIKTI